MAPDNQSSAAPTPEPALLALARNKFGTLSLAEEELFRATQEGREASALSPEKKENNPVDSANWPDDRVVRAKCISWVCTDPQASLLVTYLGLKLYGMRIDGEFNLVDAEVKFPFAAWKCAFSGDISLREAQLQRFHLTACQIKNLRAGRAVIHGSVLLRDGVKAEGEVNLEGTKIGGDLDCGGAQLSNASGFALDAHGARIEGSVFLRDGFKAAGKVNLLRTTIGGDLNCDGAQFFNAEGFALYANNAKIEGGVLLRNGFKAEGEVNLVGTTMGGSLDCDAAQFSNAGRLALNAYGAKIEGNVFLRNGFMAEGEVSLLGARIDGGLECDGAQLSDVDGFALNAEGAKIGSHAFFRGGFQAQGVVNLLGATIGSLQIRHFEADTLILDLRLAEVETFWDEEKSWPKAKNLFLDGFRYERLDENAPFEAESRKKWLSLQPPVRFRPQPYDQLTSVLRKMGHERDARRVFLAKNPERARYTRRFSQEWWWYNVFGKLIGYGHRPGRAFCISLAMIALGTILFTFGSAYGLVSPTSESAYAKEPNGQVIVEKSGRSKISEKHPVFNSFFYSLESFTPLLKLDQSANWAPNANHGTEIPIVVQTPATALFHVWLTCTGSLLRYYLYFHIAAGWLLTSLWVGAITGLVKT